MTESAINPNINEEFPYSGVNNPLQGFRDNFSIIKSSLTDAKMEITDLFNTAIRIDSKDINFNGRIVTNAVFKNAASYRYDVVGLQTADFDIDYTNGNYQIAQIGADLTINLKNFPADTDVLNNIGSLHLHLYSDTVTHKVRFVTTNANIRYNNDIHLVNIDKLRIPGSSIKNPIILEIWKDNGPYNPTMYIKSEGLYRIHEAPPPAPISYIDDVTPVTSVTSTASSTNDKTPGIKVGTDLSPDPLLYVDDQLTPAVYNSSTGSLTPVNELPDGTHKFSYAIIDQNGYTGTSSAYITIAIDTSAPTTGSIQLSADTGSSSSDWITKNGEILVGGLETGSSWEYSIDSGSIWINGSGTKFTIPAGTYAPGVLKVRQTDANGNIQTTNIPTISTAITVDTTPPTTGYFELSVDTGSSSSDGITNNGQLNISSLETDSTWEYSTDSGSTWANGSGGTSFTLLAGTYAIGAIQIRQTDVAGNLQITNIASNQTIITVDTTTPTSGTLTLTVDDGVSSSDGNSTNGSITVGGLESGATWQYSSNSGSTWTTGTGSSFTLAAGVYTTGQLKVRQTDMAGNVQTTLATNAFAITIGPPTPVQVAYTTSGLHSWTAPAGVTTVCVVAVGGGGGGQGSSALDEAGGGGGGLGWRNNIQVIPGSTYQLRVGGPGIGSSSGDDSWFISPGTVTGGGGYGSSLSTPGAGGSFVGDGGGNGGAGGGNGGNDSSSFYGGGGGGAGGYTGVGGDGGNGITDQTPGMDGQGGGGGGGCSGHGGGGGGGVGLLGKGANGPGASSSKYGGGAGSGGVVGGTGGLTDYEGGNGGTYGGGGGGGADGSRPNSSGGGGAVRIIWGNNRAFPSTNTGDL